MSQIEYDSRCWRILVASLRGSLVRGLSTAKMRCYRRHRTVIEYLESRCGGQHLGCRAVRIEGGAKFVTMMRVDSFPSTYAQANLLAPSSTYLHTRIRSWKWTAPAAAPSRCTATGDLWPTAGSGTWPTYTGATWRVSMNSENDRSTTGGMPCRWLRSRVMLSSGPG